MPQAKKRMGMPQIGEWAFIIGILLAVAFGLFPSQAVGVGTGTLTAILVVLGIAVGFLNVSVKETTGYLLAALALIIGGSIGFGTLPVVGDALSAILTNVTFFVSPAAIIVALKTIFALARNA